MATTGGMLLLYGAGAYMLSKLLKKKTETVPVTSTSTPISDRPIDPIKVTLNTTTDLVGIMFTKPEDATKVIQITKVDPGMDMAYGEVIRGTAVGEGFGASAAGVLELLKSGVYTQVV